MLDDNAIVYEREIKHIKLLLNNIVSIGIDISSFEASLVKITDSTKEELEKIRSKDDNMTTRMMFINQLYSNKIQELRKFKMGLEQYIVYYKTYNKCNYINSFLSENLNKEKLDSFIDEIIESLTDIRKSDTIDYDEEAMVVEKLYETVYALIKLEIKIKGTSKLLDYCNTYETDVVYLNTLLEKDLKENPSKRLAIYKSKVNYENANQLHLDLELLKYLVFGENDHKLKEDFLEKAKNVATLLGNGEQRLDYLNSKKIINENNYEKLQSDKKKTNIERFKKGIKNIATLILTSSIVLGAYTLGYYIAKEEVTEEKYKTESTILVDGETDVENTITYEKAIGDFNPEGLLENTSLKIYYPWEKAFGGYKRSIRVYDLSDIKYDNLEAYLNLDLSLLGRKYETEYERKEELSPEDLYYVPAIEISKNIQHEDDMQSSYNKNDLIFVFLLNEIWLTIIMAYISFSLEDTGFKIWPIANMIEQYDYYKDERRFNLENREATLAEIKAIDEEIAHLIKDNERLKAEYASLLQSRGYQSIISTIEAKDEEMPKRSLLKKNM